MDRLKLSENYEFGDYVYCDFARSIVINPLCEEDILLCSRSHYYCVLTTAMSRMLKIMAVE